MSLERISYAPSYFLSDSDALEEADLGKPFGEVDEFQQACADGDVAKVKECISNGSGKIHSLTPVGYSPLDIAVARGQKDVIETLLTAGADVNFTAPRRVRGALTTAVANDNEDIVDILVAAGAALDAVDANGRSLVSAAIFNKNIPLAKKLMEAGAPVDVRAPSSLLQGQATATSTVTASDEEAVEDVPSVSSPMGSALYSAALREDEEAVALVLPHTDLKYAGARALIALASTGDDNRAVHDGSAFQLIFQRMLAQEALELPDIQHIILETIRGRKINILRKVIEAAVAQKMDVNNHLMEIPDSYVFLWVKFKTAKKNAFQELFGEVGNTVRAYPACAATIVGWEEGTELLLQDADETVIADVKRVKEIM